MSAENVHLGPGSQVASYTIIGPLGVGGSGTVYRAKQAGASPVVALKVMNAEHLDNESELQRFAREAEVVKKLAHPHVVGLLDYGYENGLPYLVFPLLEGRTLEERIAKEGALNWTLMGRFSAQVLSALEVAHGMGIAHRDIKPANIFLCHTAHGEVIQILDFGTAKIVGDKKQNVEVTRAGILVGTPRYMAPEQVRMETLTPAADVYAFGLVMAEMMLGRPLVSGKSEFDIFVAQGSDKPHELPDAILASPFATVISRAIAKPLEVRYRLASQMLADVRAILERFGAGEHGPGEADMEATQFIGVAPEPEQNEAAQKLRKAFNAIAAKTPDPPRAPPPPAPPPPTPEPSAAEAQPVGAPPPPEMFDAMVGVAQPLGARPSGGSWPAATPMAHAPGGAYSPQQHAQPHQQQAQHQQGPHPQQASLQPQHQQPMPQQQGAYPQPQQAPPGNLPPTTMRMQIPSQPGPPGYAPQGHAPSQPSWPDPNGGMMPGAGRQPLQFSPAPAPMPVAKAAPPKGGAGKVIAVLFLVLVVGGAVAAYFLRARLGRVLAIFGLAVAVLGCGDAPPPGAREPLVATVAAPPPIAPPAASAEPASARLAVGVVLSLSGEDTVFGHDTLQGIQLAFDELGKSGPQPFELLVEDDHSLPADATGDALELAARGVIGILGENTSSRTRAAGIVAQKKGIPILTPTATHPDLVKVGDFVFRACFDDGAQGRMAAAHAAKLGKKRVAILSLSDDLYSSGMAKEFEDEALRRGVSIVKKLSFIRRETDFTSGLRDLARERPDLVFAPVYYSTMVQVARAAKVVHLAPEVFLGGDGWSATQLLKDAGAELEGATFIDHWVADFPGERARAFAASYRARFSAEPTSLGALGYDAAAIFLDAVHRAKAPTREAVRDALAATRDFPGLVGPVTFGPGRVTRRAGVVVAIHDGKFTYRDTAGP